ncbi:MAG: GTPase [Candidatus Thorarchaeota archaeon]
MPTNVSPKFDAQRKVYEQENNLEQKIKELEKLISLLPRHKGAENMRGHYRRKLARLKDELEKKREQEKLRRSGKAEEGAVRKEGAGQVCLLGMANSGKSSIINAVTNADFDVADYPFTTPKPTPAMLELEDINIQLVELPGVFEGSYESDMGRKSLAVARNADCIAIIIDLSRDVSTQMEIIKHELDRAGIRLNREPSAVRVERVGMGGLQVYGADKFKGSKKEVYQFLQKRKVRNMIVRFQKEATLQDLEDALDASVAYVRALIIATKGDTTGSEKRFEEVQEEYSERFEIVPISVVEEKNIEEMNWAFYDHLDILRVYTKIPGKDREDKPIVLPKGSIVEDAAVKVHKELFVERFRAAVIIRNDAKVQRRQVGLKYPLNDGDILQLMHS